MLEDCSFRDDIWILDVDAFSWIGKLDDIL